jgi:hypothetical protein
MFLVVAITFGVLFFSNMSIETKHSIMDTEIRPPIREFQVAATTTEFTAESFTDTYSTFTDDSYATDGDWGTAVYETTAVTADYRPVAYFGSFDLAQSGSGSITQVDCIIRTSVSGTSNDEWGWIMDVSGAETTLRAEASGDQSLTNLTYTDVTEPNGSGWTWAEVWAAAVELDYDKVTSADDFDIYIYEICLKVTWEAVANNVPANDQAPTLDNPTESSKIFSYYSEYQVTMYASDADGFADIDYMELGYWDNTQTTEYWRFRYDEDTNTFTEEYDAGNYVVLNTGGSSATESVNDIDATFYFEITWVHPDITANGDAKCYVVDDEPESDTDWYEVTWTVETRLDYTTAPYVSGDDAGTNARGDLDETFYIDGTLEYYGSTDIRPPSDHVDMWISASEYGTNEGPWSDLTLTSGAFQVTCYADDAVGQDTYTIKPVDESAGSGGTSLYYTTDLTDTYIADQITVQTTTVDDGRVDVDANAEIRVTLWLEYDDSYLGSGDSVTLDGAAMSWDGTNSWFDLARTKSSVGVWKYFVNSTSHATHGVTGFILNSQDVDVIFDRIQILTTTVVDGRIDISTNAEIRVTAQLEYDSHTLGSGDTLYMEDIQMTWDASGWFDLLSSQGSVGIWKYFVNSSSASEATYGITVVNLDSNDVNVIWDRVQILTTTATDGRIDYGTSTTISVTAQLEYDSHALGSGDTLYMNDTSMTWDTDHFYLTTGSYNIVDLINYFVNSSNANEVTYGITVVNLDSNNVDVIWDRILILTTTVVDGRIDISTNAEIRVTAELEYDSHTLGSGDTLYMEDTQMTWDAGGWFDLLSSQSSVAAWNYFINSSNANEATYGITVVNLDSNEVAVIWDRIIILTTTSQDGRIDVSTSADIRVTAQLEYDSHALGSGDTLNMDDTGMSWVSSYFQYQPSQASVGAWLYHANATGNEATYGITVVNLDSNEVAQIWDRIQILTTTATDGRIDYGTSTTVNVTAQLEYDSHALGSGDTLYMNDTSMTWDTDHFYITTGSYSIVDLINYFINSSSANEATYGITVVNLDSNNADVIWDRIQIVTTTAMDSRIDISTNAELRVTAQLEYDSHALGSGDTLYMDDAQMTWDASGWFDLLRSQGSVGAWKYFVNSSSASEATYGITVVNLDSNEQDVIWDRIIILTTTSQDSRIDYNTQADIRVTAQLEYDSHALGSGDTLYMNGTGMSWVSSYFQLQPQFAEVNAWLFFVNSSSASEATHGITVVNLDSNEVAQIWDRIIILTTTTQDGRIDYGTSADIRVTAQLEYDNHALGTGDTLYMDDTGMSWESSYFQYTPSKSAVDVWKYFVNSSNANEATYGITVVNLDSNEVDQIWDRIIILTTTSQDSRIDYNTQADIRVTAQLEYDNHALGSGDTLYMNGTSMSWVSSYFQLQPQFAEVNAWLFFVNSSSASEVTYGITVVNLDSNEVDQIWDRIIILTTSATDGRIDYGTSTTVNVTAELEYDSHTLGSGDTLYMNDTSMTWDSDHFYLTTGSYSIIDLINYFVNSSSASEATYGITVVNLDSNEASVIWDRILILTTTVVDGRIDVSTNAEIRVTAELEYDSHTLGSGDTLYMEDTQMTWDASGWFDLLSSQGSVDVWKYFVNSSSANEATYGITVINLDSNEVDVIWDRILILTTTSQDSRIDYDTQADIRVTAELEYDSHALGSGDTLYMNGTGMSWVSSYFQLQPQFAEVNAWLFFVNSSSASEATHGITVVNLDSNEVSQIWDRIIIDMQADDETVNNDVQVNFTLTVTYEYDSTTCTTYTIQVDRDAVNWNTFTNGNKSLFVDTNSDVAYDYNASSSGSGVSETTYGLTVFTTNTETVTWSAAGNDAPVNETTPSLTNGDNTDYLYARYRYYIIISNVSDLQGYADISYVELSLYTNDRGTEKWRIRYTVSGSAFSIQVGSGLLVISSDSYADESGNDIGVVWYIKIDWDHGDYEDIDTKQYVYDGTDEDTDWDESDWNTECRITYTVTPYLSDDRGDINTADLQADGTVQYYGYSLAPRANETDVWILHDVSGTWSGDIDGAGAFTITSVGSSANVRLNTYTFKVVSQGGGSGATDLYFTTSLTDTFITDRIEFYTSGVDDGRIDISTNGLTYWLARYDYDDVAITSGLTAALNGSKSLSHNGTHWIYSESKGSAQHVGYQIDSASETTYSLTSWTMSASATTIIWDSLTCTVTNPSDQHIDLNANATGIYVSAVYDYDGATFDGVLTLNDTTYAYATVGIHGYTVSSATDDSYGITTIATNDDTNCIWDQVLVSAIDTNYTYVDHSETVQINVTLLYDYDDTVVIAGTFAINTESLTHIELGRWQVHLTKTDAFHKVLDNLTSCSATQYGITVYSMNSLNVSVYWDKIEFYASSVTDSRIDINTFGYTQWSARLLSATSVVITSQLSAKVTGDIDLAYTGGYWVSEENSTSITNVTYSITFASLEAISQYSQTASNVSIVWDRIKILTTVGDPTSQDATYLVLIHVTLQLEYDSSSITSGTIYLDGKTMVWDSTDSRWEIQFTETTAGTRTYYVNSTSSEDTYDITALNLNGKNVTIAWGDAPDTGSGNDYDRTTPTTSRFIIHPETIWLIVIGLIAIGAVYIYGFPFIDAEGFNGLSPTERRNLYRSIREQTVRAGRFSKSLARTLWNGIVRMEATILKLKDKIERRLER